MTRSRWLMLGLTGTTLVLVALLVGVPGLDVGRRARPSPSPRPPGEADEPWTIAPADPEARTSGILFDEITPSAITLRATGLPEDVEAVYYRIAAFRTLDSLRAPTYDQPLYGYGAVIGGGEAPPDSLRYARTRLVTTTSDDGPGSLRDLLETNPVHGVNIEFAFTTPETIRVDSTIVVRASRFRLDGGARAPVTLMLSEAARSWCDSFVDAGDHNPDYAGNPRCGVLLFDGAIASGAPRPFAFNAIVRGLRIVQGGRGSADQPDDADGIGIANRAERVVVDHCTIGPSGDEAIAVGSTTAWVTVQYCVVHDNVKGMLVGNAGGLAARVSVHRNLFFRNGERNTYTAGVWNWSPGPGIPHTEVGKYEFHDNVVYDWTNKGLSLFDLVAANVTGNSFVPGPGTDNRLSRTGVLQHALRLFGGGNCCEDGTPGVDGCCPGGAFPHGDPSLLYVAGNDFPAEETDDDARTYRSRPYPIDRRLADQRLWPNTQTPLLPAGEALVEVLNEAGAPFRSEADGLRMTEVFRAARVHGLERWIPRDVSASASNLGANTPCIFEARTCRDCRTGGVRVGDWFRSEVCYTLAYPPRPLSVWRVATGAVGLAIDDGDRNPPWTEYAVQEKCTGGWVQRDGVLGAHEVWLDRDTWASTTVRSLARRLCYSFAVKARNGDHVETARSEWVSVGGR